MAKRAVLPSHLVDIHGKSIDIDALTAEAHLVIITLKRPGCPVCPQLLTLLNHYGLEINDDKRPQEFIDPFIGDIIRLGNDSVDFHRILLHTDTRFLVICPGDIEDIAKIQETFQFHHSHFIKDDKCLPDDFEKGIFHDHPYSASLSWWINLRLSANDIWPAVLQVEHGDRSLHPIKWGRAPGYYGHDILIGSLRHQRYTAEVAAVEAYWQALRVMEKWTEEETGLSTSSSMPAESSLLNCPPEVLSEILNYIDELVPISRTCSWLHSFSHGILRQRLRKATDDLGSWLPVYAIPSSDADPTAPIFDTGYGMDEFSHMNAPVLKAPTHNYSPIQSAPPTPQPSAGPSHNFVSPSLIPHRLESGLGFMKLVRRPGLSSTLLRRKAENVASLVAMNKQI